MRVCASVPTERLRSPDYADLSSAGISVVGYRSFSSGILQKIGARVVRRNPLAAHLKRHTADLVVVTHAGCYDGIDWGVACIETGQRFAFISSAVRSREWPDDSVASKIMKICLAAEFLTFCSGGNRRMFELQLGAQLPRTILIPFPCPIGREEQVPWPDSDLPLKFACLARAEPEDKGQDLILGALAHPKWKDRAIEVNCFGNGPALETLKRGAESFGVANQVRFLGHTQDLRGMWRGHHALLLPSRSEGFSLSLMEAMLLARPAITTRVGDNELVIRNGVTGCLVSSESIQELDNALEYFWTNRASLQEMGRKAREAILKFLPADPVGLLESKILSTLEDKRPSSQDIRLAQTK